MENASKREMGKKYSRQEAVAKYVKVFMEILSVFLGMYILE